MHFIYNDVDSRDLGLKVKNIPYDFLAKRRVLELVLEKFDGDNYVDKETYESFSLDIECIILDNFTIEGIERIKNVFLDGKGEIIFSHKPDCIYKVRLMNTINFTEMIALTGQCLLSFKVYPFAELISGRSYMRLTNEQEVENEGNYFSKPSFKVTGAGDITISINDIEMKFIEVTKPFIIDCDLEDVYSEDGENLNSYMMLESDFVVFPIGVNKISWTGASSVEMLPRWRRL